MAYLDTIKAGAISTWRTHRVLPSVVGAQAALESGWGTSKLAKPPYNNQFGIKASADWTGRTVNMPTREYVSGAWVTINADFRAYDSAGDSVKDHGAFFTSTPWRENNYKDVVGETDYKKACWALQNAPAPYATDTGYAQKLINLIENNNLQAWDREALADNSNTVATQTQQTVVSKMVGADLTDAGKQYVRDLNVTMIGDSLGVGTKPYFESLVPKANYDVLGSRQITHATNSLNGTYVLQQMKNAGTLKEYVVVILGTNRGVTEQEVNNFASIAGDNHKVIFVDTASEVAHINTLSVYYQDAAKRLNNVYFANWRLKANSLKPQYYSKDGANGEYIHMTPLGYQKHAEFIAQALYEVATANFTDRVAEATKAEFYNIENFELNEDGLITYDAWRVNADGTSTKYKATKQTDIKGLYSPYGESNIYNPSANLQYGLGNSVNNSNWRETYFEDSEETDGLKLIEKASLELINRQEPEMIYTVNLLEIPVELSIGDTGIFVDHEFNPPLYIRARVLSITTSETIANLNKVTIGNVTELQPQDKSALMAIRAELQETRKDLESSWIGSVSTDMTIVSTNGYILGDITRETSLVASVYKGNEDVTDQFDTFSWERISEDATKDAVFNNALSNSIQSSVLTVREKDIIGNQSKFVARTYNATGEFVSRQEIVIKRVETALWTDTDTEPSHAIDGATWTKSDGSQWVKVNGAWEERVDQEVASQIVKRDGTTVSFSNQEPGNGKSGDVWFRLNADGTESIMRNDGNGWYETVTNAMNADGIITGTMDFSLVNAIHINASSITAGHANFLEAAFTALNSKATLNGTALRIINEDGSFIEMNNVPEVRSTAPNGTSIILGNGRVHFYDSNGNSKGYMGTDMHGGTRDFGTFLSKGSGIYRFARMADVSSTEAKYYTVEPGDYRVSIIEKLVQRGELPDGNAQDFINKSNAIARLNGWAPLPQEWPTLRAGQQIKYSESTVAGGSSGNRYYVVQAGQGWNAIAQAAGVPLQTILDLNNLTINSVVHPGDTLLVELGTGQTNEEAYEDIWKFGPSSAGDWRVYFLKHARFEGGFTDVSDRRIKHDISPTSVEALPEIDQFDFKEYKMDSDGRYVDLGLIAQEAGILRVADDELEGIDIQKGIMLALKGVQELNAIIKEQAVEIAELKKQIDERGL